jgi:hypothetical protein
MSNCIFNIRFGAWHLQIIRDRPFVTLRHNPCQEWLRKSEPSWRWFEIMEAPWQ